MNKKIIILVSLLFSTSVFANDELATSDITKLFPIAAQSHNNDGKFDSQWGSVIKGARDHKVDFKHHDNLKGQCDGKTCGISYKLAPFYNLHWENNYLTLPTYNGYVSGGYELACKNNNIFTDNVFTDIFLSGGSGCTINPKEKNIYVKGKIDITSNLTLKLAPGNYWMNSLILNYGNIEVVGNGDVNLYVKEKVVLKGATIGSKYKPVNIYHYKDEDADFGGSLTWYGDFFTKGKVKYQGSTKLYGAVRAKAIDIQGSGELHLAAGEYWYDNVIVKDGAHLILDDTLLTTLHIKDQLESQGGSTINKNAKALLLFLYDDNDASLHLKGSAKLYGHVYTKGGVELNEGHIVGAVNVHSLFMKGGSITYSPLSGVSEAKLDHYQLHFNTNNDNVTAYACGDNTCNLSNLYAGEVKKLHIHSNQSNFNNFNNFYGSSSVTEKWDRSQCTIFTIQNVDNNKNGANPWPASTPALQCFLDGTRVTNCEVCPKPESVNSYGYVYGSATIPSIPSSRTNEFTVKQGGGNGLATAEDNPIAINNDSKLTLPLEVTFDKAEQVNLVLADADDREYPVSVTFVPKRLAWVNNSEQCINGEANKAHFNYQQHHGSCKVLGKAGADTTLVIKAHGEDDKLITNMPDYKIDKDSLITINELDDKKQKTDVSLALNSIKLENDKAEITYSISQVALIQAVIKEHCAPYAIDSQGECGLTTEGDSQILGRTVPASLSILEKGDGEIAGRVVYAAQPDVVKFEILPSFSIQGLDTKDNPLPSYTGEFSVGLFSNSKFKFGAELAKLSESTLKLEYFELERGIHQLELDATSLKFLKDNPFGETSLALPLYLTIGDHDQTTGVTGETNLGSNDDKLRYGFLVLKNTELAVDKPGEMPSELHYYTKDASTTAVDKNNNYDLESLNLILGIKSTVASVDYNVPTVELAAKNLDVSAFSKAWRGEVTIEGDSDEFVWLKPYSKATGRLVYPKGQLVISDRKRGHDRVFNRREAVR